MAWEKCPIQQVSPKYKLQMGLAFTFTRKSGDTSKCAIGDDESQENDYSKSSIKPPGAYLQKRILQWGLIRGEGLFQSLTFSLRVEQQYTIHFPRKYIYQSTSISSQSTISIVSSAGAVDSMSSSSGVKDFPPPRSFIWFYLSKHALYACRVEIRINPGAYSKGAYSRVGA